MQDDQNNQPSNTPLPETTTESSANTDVVIEPSAGFSRETDDPQQNQASAPSASVQDQSEQIVLQDTGYLQNLFQVSVAAKPLNLTLYQTHLEIKDANSDEVLEDVPLNQVKTSRYISSRFYWTLYTIFFSSLFILKTPRKRYKISWVNRDKEAFVLGSTGASEVSAQQNYDKNMEWISTIRHFQAR